MLARDYLTTENRWLLGRKHLRAQNPKWDISVESKKASGDLAITHRKQAN